MSKLFWVVAETETVVASTTVAQETAAARFKKDLYLLQDYRSKWFGGCFCRLRCTFLSLGADASLFHRGRCLYGRVGTCLLMKLAFLEDRSTQRYAGHIPRR